MRITRADVVAYGGVVEGARSATLRWDARKGILLRVVGRDGLVGQGEASPLPGYSKDDLDAARRSLQRLDWETLVEADDGETPGMYLERLAPALEHLPPSS